MRFINPLLMIGLCAILTACNQKSADKPGVTPEKGTAMASPFTIANLRVINASISTGLNRKDKPGLLAGSDGTIIYQTNNQWRAANTEGISETVMGFCANENNNHILAVGTNGLIAVSTDDGKKWKKLSSVSHAENFFSCHYNHSLNRWLIGSDGGAILYNDNLENAWQRSDAQERITHLYSSRGDNFLLGTGPEFVGHSADGGRTWQKILSITGAGITGLLDLKTHLLVTTDQGTLWRSQDLIHWDEISVQPNSALLGIAEDVTNKTLSLITSLGDIYISDDEGAHWGVAFHAEGPLAYVGYNATHKHLLAAGSSGIFYSDNGGRVWQKSGSDFNSDITFIAEAQNDIFAFGPGGFIATSTDGGKQWIMQRPSISHFIHQIKPGRDNSLVLTGANGLLLHSNDGGESWQRPQAAITEQDFLFSLLITRDAYYAAGPPGTILRSTDNGQHWQTLLSIKDASKGYFHHIISGSNDTLVAIASPGNSLFSVDKGENWQPFSIATDQPLSNGIYDPSHQKFFIVGNGGSIFGSSDGRQWQQLPSNTTANLQSITAIDKYLYASGSQGTILRSENGGKDWQLTTSNTKEAIQNIVAAGDLVVATGLHGTMLRSSDRGVRWQTVPVPESENLRAPVIDEDTGIMYVSGRSGRILFSRDQGMTWNKMPEFTQASIKGLHIDKQRHMLMGYGERLIRVPLLNKE